jgi:hypothetical protein
MTKPHPNQNNPLMQVFLAPILQIRTLGVKKLKSEFNLPNLDSVVCSFHHTTPEMS